MSVRAVRRLLFGVLALCLPGPMAFGFDAFVPAVRYLILFGAALAVVAAEGAAGPVPLIVAVFGLHALFYLLVSWALAWLTARALAGLPPRARAAVALALCAAALAAALVLEPYRTSFGGAPRAGLFGLLS